jgi:hypothetical protein
MNYPPEKCSACQKWHCLGVCPVVTPKYIALCTAPAGGCGFRGRNWRGGQEIARFSSAGPLCQCGSPIEIRELKTRKPK